MRFCAVSDCTVRRNCEDELLLAIHLPKAVSYRDCCDETARTAKNQNERRDPRHKEIDHDDGDKTAAQHTVVPLNRELDGMAHSQSRRMVEG